MIRRQRSAERAAVTQHNSTGAVAIYTLLPRRCYKGKRLVTSSSAVPSFRQMIRIRSIFWDAWRGKTTSLMFHFTQNIQVRQQWRWACNLWFCATHNMGGPPPTTNNTPTRCLQQTTQYLSTGIKRKNLKKNNLVEHIKLIMGGWVGTTRFTQLDYREWSETTCTLAYIRRHVSSAWQPVS